MFGLDVLAAAKYRSVAARNTLPAAGVFLSTFGDASKAIKALAKKCTVIRVHGVWSDTHSFGPKQQKEAIAGAKKVAKIAEQFPGVHFFYSPYCEHKLKASAMLKVLEACNRAAPGLQLVNTPIKGGAYVDGYINEVHHDDHPPGLPKGRYFFSFDGKNAVDSDVEKYKATHERAEIFFFWIPQFNQKKSMKDSTPRPKRTVKPDAKLMRSVMALAEDRGPVNLPAKYLYKSHAEQHESPAESRANKPVVIIPQNVAAVRLVSLDGKTIATAPNGGRYQGGGYLYRFKDYGYRYGGKARLMAGSKELGIINPAFRAGNFR